jgi:hypothetical protein
MKMNIWIEIEQSGTDSQVQSLIEGIAVSHRPGDANKEMNAAFTHRYSFHP